MSKEAAIQEKGSQPLYAAPVLDEYINSAIEMQMMKEEVGEG